MRLFYEGNNLEIEIREGHMVGICFEDSSMFRAFTENLWNQSNGEEGAIFLTKGDKSVKLHKESCVIFNPYFLDVNDRKVLSHIYDEMRTLAEQDYYVKLSELNAGIVSLLDGLELRLPYPLEYSLELDFPQLLKLYGVKVEMQGEGLMERVVYYIRLLHQVLGTELFVFVHLMDFFQAEEMGKLEEMVGYEQISVLLVENRMSLEPQENKKWWIIDKDSCIIEL